MATAIAFFLFCAVCTVLAFARHPIYGLYFYLATFYVHPPSRWWAYMIPDLRWSLLSAGVAILAVILHRGRLAAKPPWITNGAAVVLSMYAVWMWIQMPWALDTQEHIDGSTKFVKFLVAFWLVYRLADSKEALREILFAHAAGCTLLGIFCQLTGRDGGRLDGVGGPGLDDANTLGLYLATGVIAAFGLFMLSKGWRRWASLAMMALIANGFVLANSRGAFLGLVAGALVVMLCKSRQHRRPFWALSLVGVLAFTSIVDTVFIERMFTIGDVAKESDDADMSARSRVEIYKAQARMAGDYPFGAGYRGTVVLSRTYLDRKWLARDNGADDPEAGRSSHNTLMTTLVEQGWPGLFMFVLLLGWLLLAGVRVRRMRSQEVDPEVITLAAVYCAGLVIVMVAGSATDYLMAEVQFWLFAGLASALQLGGSLAPAGSPALVQAARADGRGLPLLPEPDARFPRPGSSTSIRPRV